MLIRKCIFPVLIVTLSVVLFFAVKSAINEPATRTSLLGAIVSSISGITAIVVAYWSESRERSHRFDESAKVTEKQRQTRERVAALYSSEITAWLNRKDLQDIVGGLRDIEAKESVQSSMSVMKIAKRHVQPDGTSSTGWDREITYLARALQMKMFQRMRDLPSVWTTQFRREDVDILEGNAPDYFVSMGTIWINLVLKGAELAGSPGTLSLVYADETHLIPLFIDALFDDAIELRTHLEKFLESASSAAESLKRLPPVPDKNFLSTPLVLLSQSRDSPQRLSKVWKMLSLLRLTRGATQILDESKSLNEDLQAGLTESQALGAKLRMTIENMRPLTASDEE